ncbi:MAG: endonuclease domain-containing protein [Kineosporiaceae bacterium]
MFRGSQAVSAGLLTSGQLETGGWRRLYRDVYADPTVSVDHRLLCRGAALLLPSGSAVSGRSAAHLLGCGAAVGHPDHVEATVPTRAAGRTRDGLVLRRQPLAGHEVVTCGGLTVTGPLRTAWDVASRHPPVVSVPVLDEMLRRRILTEADLHAHVTEHTGRWGAVRVRAAVSMADPGAESPPESRLRVALTTAGLRPETQVLVTAADGRVVARVDLGFRAERVGVEYDGAHHRERSQFAKDRRRLNDLQAAGWLTIFVTSADLANLSPIVDRVRGALLTRRR